jgi:hypothetical protein
MSIFDEITQGVQVMRAAIILIELSVPRS